MKKDPNYLVIVADCEGAPTGTPEVVAFADYERLQQEATAATGDNCGYRILAEIAGEDYQTVSKTVSDCDRKVCTYYTHYELYYQPTEENPYQLSHEAFHAAEERCEIAQKKYIECLEDPERMGRPIPDHLERQARHWENVICA